MQGIFRLIVLAACFETFVARPRERAVRVMAGVWLRPGPLQAGGISATRTLLETDHASPSHPLPPCPTELRCPQVMNAPLEAPDLTGSARTSSTRNNKRITIDKSSATLRDPWRAPRSTPRDSLRHRHRRRPSPPSRRDSRKAPPGTPTPLRGPMKTLGRRRRGFQIRRSKRSAVQGTIVRYVGFKDVKFRLQGPLALYLTLAPSGSALRLSTFQANCSCFRVHKFEEITTSREGGWPVMLEVHGGSYLHGNASGLLSLVTSDAGVATVALVDSSFFRLNSYTGDNTIKIKHILTALHVQARVNDVSLVSTNPLTAEGMLFHEFDCT